MQFNGFCSSPPTMMMICRCRERWQQQQNLIIQSNFAGKQKKILFYFVKFSIYNFKSNIYNDGDDDENVSHLQKKKLNSSN